MGFGFGGRAGGVVAVGRRVGFGFGFCVGRKKSLMSVCLSFLLRVLRSCLNCCALNRFFALRFSGLGCFARALRALCLVVIGGAGFGIAVAFAASLAASLSQLAWSFASFSSSLQSPLTGVSMHKSPACGAL